MITPRDTIAANDSVLDAFRQSGDYDYVRDLGTSDGNDVNYFDVLTQKAGEMFDVDMSWLVLPEWFWWILGGVALAAVGYLIWKYRAKLFSPQDNKPKVQEITEDDINEVDFDQLIDEAQRNGELPGAVPSALPEDAESRQRRVAGDLETVQDADAICHGVA